MNDVRNREEDNAFFSKISATKSGLLLIRNFFHLMLPVVILLLLSVMIVYGVIVPLIEKQHLDYKKQLCSRLVEAAISDLQSRERDVASGLISRERAMKRAVQRLRSFRFGEEGKDYYWIVSPRMRFIMHPYRPDMENVNPDEIESVGNESITDLMMRMHKAVEGSGRGYLRYSWHWKDDLTRVESKISYLQKFEPWGWIVGTGVYLEDMERELAGWKRTFVASGLILTGIACLFAFVLSVRSMRLKKSEIEAIERLRLNEDKFRSVFNYSPFAIAINILERGDYISVNPAFLRFLNQTREQVLGKTWSDTGLRPGGGADDVMNELLEKGNITNRESSIDLSEDDRRVILYSSALINFEGREAVLTMLIDITQERVMEETLFQAQKLDVIGQLAGGIAHDFNNMLAGIMGGAELLKLKIDRDAPIRGNVDSIVDVAQRASELTQKLLTFSRKNSIVKKRVDLHEIIKEAAVLLERSIDRRIDICLKLNAVDSFVSGDSTLLQNVILNLGLNARDAMNDGGVLKVSTANLDIDEKFCSRYMGEVEPGRYIEIDVADTGTGMSKETVLKIFDPFFTTKTLGKGTGLGMSVVYGTVREHGGAVNVYSEEGHGTVIKIFLPLNLESDEKEFTGEEEIVYGRGRILFIDDEKLVREIGSSLLESLGYEVVTAADGEEGVCLFREDRSGFDLVILDMVMPRLNGMETFEILKDADPDVRVLFSSGFTKEGSVGELMSRGAAGFIQKPYQYSVLSRAVCQAMNKSKG